jgi:hypothetical protein
MDSGPEAISDGVELEQVRRQAGQVRKKALTLALALTALVLLTSLIV